MTAEYMTIEAFERNRSTIDIEVQTILAAKKQTRRRFRSVAMYEKSSGELLAEVFTTSVGPVIVYRAPVVEAGLRGLRQDTKRRGIAPFTGSAGQWITLSSKGDGGRGLTFGSSYPVNGAHIITRNYPGDRIVFD
jgi:hypothetical protein